MLMKGFFSVDVLRLLVLLSDSFFFPVAQRNSAAFLLAWGLTPISGNAWACPVLEIFKGLCNTWWEQRSVVPSQHGLKWQSCAIWFSEHVCRWFQSATLGSRRGGCNVLPYAKTPINILLIIFLPGASLTACIPSPVMEFNSSTITFQLRANLSSPPLFPLLKVKLRQLDWIWSLENISPLIWKALSIQTPTPVGGWSGVRTEEAFQMRGLRWEPWLAGATRSKDLRWTLSLSCNNIPGWSGIVK